MMAYERSESAQDNFGNVPHQIFYYVIKYIYIYIYIYIYMYIYIMMSAYYSVTLCRWSAKQTVWTQDLDVTGSRKGTLVRELDQGTQRKQLAKSDASGQSSPDSRSDQSA